MKAKLIILDRDGVINDHGFEYICSKDDWHSIPSSLQAIANLCNNGTRVVVCTNQSGVARGYFTLAQLAEIHSKMQLEVACAGGKIDKVYFCPHHPNDSCSCRKPQPGMIISACQDYQIDTSNPQIMSEVIMIGDSITDLQAINKVGGLPVLVKTGAGNKTIKQHLNQIPKNTLIFDDLLSFSHYLLNKSI